MFLLSSASQRELSEGTNALPSLSPIEMELPVKGVVWIVPSSPSVAAKAAWAGTSNAAIDRAMSAAARTSVRLGNFASRLKPLPDLLARIRGIRGAERRVRPDGLPGLQATAEPRTYSLSLRTSMRLSAHLSGTSYRRIRPQRVPFRSCSPTGRAARAAER